MFIYTKSNEMVNVNNVSKFGIEYYYDSYAIFAFMNNGDFCVLSKYTHEADAKQALKSLALSIYGQCQERVLFM